MNRTVFPSAILLILLLVALPAAAQRGGGERPQDPAPAETGSAEETPGDETEEAGPTLAEAVLLDLSAWRHKEAREKLEADKEERGTTIPHDTLWALLLAEEKDYDEAIEKLTSTSKSDTTDPGVSYYLGEIHSWKRQKDSAKKAWKEARKRAEALIEDDAANASARFWLGAALIRLGSFEEAADELEQALEDGAEPAMTEFQTGLTHTYRRQWQKAHDAFTRCLDEDSGYAHAYYYRGLVSKELGKTEEMLLDMDRFLALAPDAREANAARSMLSGGG